MSAGYVVDHDLDIPYCRSINAERLELQRELIAYAGLDGDKKVMAVALPSGMAAIGCLFQVILKQWAGENPHFVLGNELYCDTPRTIGYLAEMGIPFTYAYVDVTDHDQLCCAVNGNRKNLAMVFVETCSNPSGRMCDLPSLAQLIKKNAPRCVLCVDNTWASFALFDPFAHGAQVVVESLTKYGSGGTCIGGAIFGRGRLMKRVERWIQVFGGFMTPHHCQMLVDGLRGNLAGRVEAAGALAIRVAEWLESRKEVDRVLHPTLVGHPTFVRNQDLLGRDKGPGVVLFHVPVKLDVGVPNPKKLAKEVVAGDAPLRHIRLETSYGSAYSKICPWAGWGKTDKFEKAETKDAAEGLWLRLAVGYESSFEEVVSDLSLLLRRAQNVHE